jgi:NADH dehydrogenase [ubiquinone] 1 alpha subcomplex assembly factor 1
MLTRAALVIGSAWCISTAAGALLSSSSASPSSGPNSHNRRVLIDFTCESTVADWVAVDDRIMGGATTSRVVHRSGCTSFEGDLVVEGGGFASVRYTAPFRLPREVEVLALEACSDGRMGYKLTLTSSSAQPGVSYQLVLPRLSSGGSNDGDAGVGGFQTLRLPLTNFKPTYRGRPAPEAPPLRADEVNGLGLMLSRYEVEGGVKESIAPGAFRLRLRSLATAESDLAMNWKRWVSR